MAGVAQLVRASVCGTECRQFESGRPPHKIHPPPKRWGLILSGRTDESWRKSRSTRSKKAE